MKPQSIRKISFILLLTALLFGLGIPVLAQSPTDSGRVIIGSNFVLSEDEVVEGDVTVLGGNFTMQEGSEVEGDVVVFGGNVSINGKVEGDVASLGGSVQVLDKAEINGSVVSMGGTISISEDAEVDGGITQGFGEEGGFTVPIPPTAPSEPNSPESPRPDEPRPEPREESRQEAEPRYEYDYDDDYDYGYNYNDHRPSLLQRIGWFFADGIQDIFTALLIAGLAVLIVLFFPNQVSVVEDAMVDFSAMSIIVGFLTGLATLFLLILLALFFWLLLPICGIFLLGLAYLGALLFGWSVAGKVFGERVFDRFNQPQVSALSATLLGTGLLSLVWHMPFIDHLPLIGWLFGLGGGLVFLIVSSLSIGAVVLTRFGTQPHQPSGNLADYAPPPAPVDPTPPAEDSPLVDDEPTPTADSPAEDEASEADSPKPSA